MRRPSPTLLSCFPFLLLVLVALSAITVGSEGASLLEVIVRALPAQFDFLAGQVLELDRLRTKVTVAGALLTLWAALGVFGAISIAVNYAWGVEKRHSFLKTKLIAFLMMLTAGVFLVGALALGSAAQMVHASWFAGAAEYAPVLSAQEPGGLNRRTPLFMIVVVFIHYFQSPTRRCACETCGRGRCWRASRGARRLPGFPGTSRLQAVQRAWIDRRRRRVHAVGVRVGGHPALRGQCLRGLGPLAEAPPDMPVGDTRGIRKEGAPPRPGTRGLASDGRPLIESVPDLMKLRQQ